MALKRLILTNTLYQLLAKFVSTLATLVITVIITRVLGASTWGDYSIVVTYVTLFYLFTEFGLNSIAAREFSNSSNIKYTQFSTFFLLRFFITVTVVLLSTALLSLFNYPKHIVLAILYGQINLVFFSLASSFNAVFQAKLKYKYLFYSTLAFALVYLCAFIAVYPHYSQNLFLLFVPLTLGEVARFVTSLWYARKIVGVRGNSRLYDLTFAKGLFIATLPLAGVLLFNTLMVQVDRIMLSVMVPSIYLGYYSLSYKLFDVLLVLPTFFMNAAFPVFSKRYSQRGDYSTEFTKSLYFMLSVGVFMTLVSISLGWLVIPVIWGVEMIPAIISFNILVAGSVLFYLSSLISWSFVVENKQKLLIGVYALGFVTNVVLNYYAIHRFNYIGAAVTTIFTELIVVILLHILSRKYLDVKLVKFKNVRGELFAWKAK